MAPTSSRPSGCSAPPPAGGTPRDFARVEPAALPRRLFPSAKPEPAAATEVDPPAEANPPPPAGLILIAPKGDLAVAPVGNDIYSVTVPRVGGAVPTISVAGSSVPVKKLTDIGGEFPTWASDGRTIHWAIGNAFMSYNLDRAKVVEDSLQAVDKAKADSTRQAQGRADSLKTLNARADSLKKANAAVPDSLQSRINALKADSAKVDSLKKATDKAKADSTKRAQAQG